MGNWQIHHMQQESLLVLQQAKWLLLRRGVREMLKRTKTKFAYVFVTSSPVSFLQKP